ncbi:NAD(P)H-flavin oxidoreductase [Streptococcus infantarius subsp. infantarius]|uniref:nitroreductase family protein n=1 Tax=Streptococcus infantarius TaxID=102684 RepID=UPI001BDA2A6A|nr:nitroreductase family protein [Streptococcus infantarius]MBT0904548.1 nitroreductase family protein [Streptococcus infantarius subsp. infantarius]MBT0918460.1 nitroreductase family protein [Streptococcus infantarius subsp. infantarius]MBT0932365.1 nitroreductase family protein [Streptococcus infantarius subsp. infantarius]MCO4504038.1 NAD(P)H-flavin oxidoreductase [Streptococcus infantarius subsp. infantarius]MCO4505413.1 NAD(P)H-flavin oxidoreductase [Streptococcus infantarius subsp. infan
MPIVSNDFSDIVYNRRSIRKFDTSVKIPREEMLEILDKTVTAPSSVNMQPWRFVVVDSEEGKDKLKPFVSYNAIQNETSSAMVLIFADLKSQERAEEIYGKAVTQGKMPEEVKEKQLSSIVPMYENAPFEVMNEIVHIDSSLAAMQLMLVARSYGYDTNAIGGYKKDGLAKAFGLDEDRHVPILIIALGKADEEGFESVRLDASDVTTFA